MWFEWCLLTWVIVQITYLIAIFSSSFRKMALQTLGWWLIPFMVFQVNSTVVVSVLVWEYTSAWLFVYTFSAIFWVPLVLGFRPWSVWEMFIQRVPLAICLVAACFVSHHTWYDVPVYFRVGLTCWCVLCGLDVFLWDLLYTKWLIWLK